MAAREFSEEAEAAVSVLRAVVSSEKGLSTLQSVLHGYREVEGRPLLWVKFGFPNAEEFLKATGEFVVQTGRMGETLVSAKPRKESVHIQKMVAAQRSTKTKKSGFAVLRQPQKRPGGSWNTSAYNKNYSQMPYQTNRYIPAQRSYPPQQRYQPQLRYNPNNPLNVHFGTNPYGNRQPKPLMSLKEPPQKPQAYGQTNQGYNRSEANNNISAVKNLNNNNNSSAVKNLNNRFMAGSVEASPQRALNTNDLRHKLNDRTPPPAQQRLPSSLDLKKSLPDQPPSQPVVPPRDLNKVTIQKVTNNQSYIAPPPTPVMSPPRSVNTRLQVTKDVIPTSEPVQVQLTPRPKPSAPNGVGSPRQEFPRASRPEPPHQVVLTPPTTPPVLPLPTLPGKKSLQDRLKINQKVDSNDLEKASKVVTPQSPPPKAADFGSQSMSSAGPLTSPEPSVNLVKEPFSWNEPHATPVEMLLHYAQYNGYTRPIYKYYKLRNNRIQCRVTVNGSTYSTYPDDYKNEFDGQFAAAQAAIENIKRDEERNNYSVCLDPDFTIANKIYELLRNCTYGMFSKNIPDAFRKAYHTLLPNNWQAIIDSNPGMFSKENIQLNTIVFANVQEDNGSNVSTISNTSEAKCMTANVIELPWHEQYWNLWVTNPVSTTEIWARLVGPQYSDQMDLLITDIELSMMDDADKHKAQNVIVGEYYLICDEDCWHRVRVEDIDVERNVCSCYYIDHGQLEQVSLNEVYICDPKFLKLPGQTVCFTLDGLEDFGENPKAKPHLDQNICGKVCIGQILTSRDVYEKEEDNFGDVPRVSVILYDTSGERDIHLNLLLLNHICDDTPKPELNRTGVTSVVISYVDNDGNVHCNLQDTAMIYIQKLIHHLVQSNALEDRHRGLYEERFRSKLYLVKDEQTNKWYRASLESVVSNQLLTMLFVDVGVKKSVNIANVYRLESLSLALSRYPPQAIPMKMFNIPDVNDHLLCRLRALLNTGKTAVVKVAAISTVPLVKIFLHFGLELLCVNDIIRGEMEMENMSEVISEPRIAIGNSSNGSTVSSASGMNIEQRNKFSSPVPSQVVPKLPKFPLPPVGNLFGVSVTIASNPNYFIVQPYNSALELHHMMEQMQKFCMSQAQMVPEVQKGEVYAGLDSDDGHWYRVLVVNMCGPSLIHVYFCDFGQIKMLESEMLRILPQHLRTLPQQAVKAKLHGVQPLHGDWSIEDAVRFQQLTVNKDFVSYIRSIQADEISQNEEIVELELIDTSTEKDIHIHHILVNEKRAVLTSK